jgi:hypothetical protein
MGIKSPTMEEVLDAPPEWLGHLDKTWWNRFLETVLKNLSYAH